MVVIDHVVQLLVQVGLHRRHAAGVAQIVLHQPGQVGTAAAEHHQLFGALGQDALGIAPGVVGEHGGDDPHPVHVQPGDGVRPRLHGVEGGAGHRVGTPVNDAGDGVAGHQQGLYPALLQKREHIPGHGHDLVLGVVAIGDVGAVAKIDQLLGGQQPLHRPGHAEAADARIQNADGAVCVKHRLHDPFSSRFTRSGA